VSVAHKNKLLKVQGSKLSEDLKSYEDLTSFFESNGYLPFNVCNASTIVGDKL